MTTQPTSYTIRDAHPGDLAAYVTILNTDETYLYTPQAFVEAERFPRQIASSFQRLVLEDAEGRVQGTAVLFTNAMRPGVFMMRPVVAPDARRRGYGEALFKHAYETALAQSGRTLEVSVRDVNPEGRAWAQRRGFTLHFHRFESTLDLTTFDEAAHADVTQRVADAGITFEDMRTLGSDEANWSRLYDFNADRTQETPDYRGMLRLPVEQSRGMLREAPEVRPEWIVLATRGEEWLGFSVMASLPHGAYNAMAGVAPEDRAMGLARALKVDVIRRVRAAGFSRMITNNLSINAPMLAVNRRLGFEAQPGTWVMQRTLA
ncbi:GNAT family N-acetyltransferase [Deinococcus yavapaiensis]|uniref:L-amino acid N-acyltransferase YncA n=1 Tax=Deinococcus yavapaiensis KR-236 TaxID=694435 RepID=A0A318S1Z7_9DEIO|nr:GNAT family N-acetyltransferase [Deinococcus yavapaiensis]PYE51956.1 L-amino acid N-acyltransferase YncA [Deinococcus yavapaiensis KR-236]